MDNERGLASGWLDPELSETGRRQAEELGERRLAEHVDVVFSSDLRRAAETAQIAFGQTRIPMRHDWRLRECNYGDLNGANTTVLKRARTQHVEAPFPTGESYRDVTDRVRDFLTDLAREWRGASVVVIGHCATRWAMDHVIRGTSLEELVAADHAWQPGWRYCID